MGDPEVNPEAFISGAREFKRAADTLCEAIYANVGRDNCDPAYVLFFHAAELALKGSLTAHGKTGRQLRAELGHGLMMLLREAAPHLKVAGEDVQTVENVMGLLDDANKYQGLRYFGPHQRTLPDLAYTREGVAIVLKAAAEDVAANPKNTGRGRVDFRIGKPVDATDPDVRA